MAHLYHVHSVTTYILKENKTYALYNMEITNLVTVTVSDMYIPEGKVVPVFN
jgi:hypothetical protein